ncbi:sortase [Candidatus Saccharibacteria bacterium]|nr:sortase [Candidatus Saccharibacteria bacterium]
MDDDQKKRVEELARERVKMAFGQQRIDTDASTEVNQLLAKEESVKNSDDSIFGTSGLLQAAQSQPQNDGVQDTHDPQASGGYVEATTTVSSSTSRVTDNVEEYHKAWSEYYHKYYQHHFGQEMQKKDEEYQAEVSNLLAQEDTIDRDARLMQRLRQQVRSKTRTSARKFRRSKHYIPLLFGLLVFVSLLFIQYNRVFFALITTYVTPVGNARGLDLLANDDPDGPPRLIIPKINLSVGINFDCGMDRESQQECMRDGILHFRVSGANSRPGENGNFALSGHSSNDAFGPGDYKFIFAQLPRLVVGDLAYVNYNGVRYTYRVTRTEVVAPNDVEALRIGNDRPAMTLITCYPIGTLRQRMLVFFEQISPVPDGETPGPSADYDSDQEVVMAGAVPTLFERLWARLTGRPLD